MKNKTNDLKIKILKTGDSVLNVFNYAENVAIAVNRKNKSVDIILLNKNKDGLPAIETTWTICKGDGEIEFSSNNCKVSTF